MFSISPHGLLRGSSQIEWKFLPFFSSIKYFSKTTKVRIWQINIFGPIFIRFILWSTEKEHYFEYFPFSVDIAMPIPNKFPHQVQSQGNLCAFNVSGLQKCEIYSDGLKFIRLPQNICNVKIQTGKVMSKFKSHFV